ncbi:MAG: hypothetical protein GX616_16405 [Planctomycetes bacterium]|nr:hypothetical protein [Planctomycetota bacterium]
MSRGKFYEAWIPPEKDDGVFRELLLTETEDDSRHIKCFRPPQWALCAIRIGRIPATMSDAQKDDDAAILMTVLRSTNAGEPHRYDRVIIVQNGENDSVEETIGFLRKWAARMMQERRVFLARLPDKSTTCSEAELEQAVGAASLVE